MTIYTIGGSARVPSVGMTQRTVCSSVLPVEWPDDVVIEGGSQPTVRRGTVAGLAVGGETRL